MWSALLALHLIGIVGYNLILRKSLLGETDRWTLATLLQTGITLPLIVVVFFYPLNLSVYTPANIALMLCGVVLTIMLHVTSVKALQYLEASVFSVLYSLRIILSAILGVTLLGEPIIPLQIIGGILIFIAIVTVKQADNTHTKSKLGVRWGLASAVTITLLSFTEKLVYEQMNFLDYVIPAWVLALIVMWAILLQRRAPINSSLLQPQLLWLMGFRAISAYGFSIALAIGGILSVTIYISSLNVIIVVILGVLFLGEKDYLSRKILAAVLAFAGFTAILLGSLAR